MSIEIVTDGEIDWQTNKQKKIDGKQLKWLRNSQLTRIGMCLHSYCVTIEGPICHLWCCSFSVVVELK